MRFFFIASLKKISTTIIFQQKHNPFPPHQFDAHERNIRKIPSVHPFNPLLIMLGYTSLAWGEKINSIHIEYMGNYTMMLANKLHFNTALS